MIPLAAANGPDGGTPLEHLHPATQGILLFLGMIVLGLTLLRLRRRLRDRQEEDFRIPPISSRRTDPSTSAQGGEIASQIESIGSKMSKRLDNQIQILTRLCREADERILHLQDLLGPKGESKGREGRPARPGPTAPPPEAPAPSGPGPHAEVYRLADEGIEPPEIARRTGRDTGEVELILNLRERA